MSSVMVVTRSAADRAADLRRTQLEDQVDALTAKLSAAEQRASSAVAALITIAGRSGGGAISAMELAREAQAALNALGVEWRSARTEARAARCPHAIKVTFFPPSGARETRCQACGIDVPSETTP